ncbi:MAG: MotA/TolQ/ExbB proton channel family protein [Chitinivibrionales bacterium]|nr:MotA/TolQ/ExbB proton channel family protein [Chitinivibrionales bacterium]
MIIRLLIRLFNEGGWVIWPILLVSVIGLYIGIGKIFRFMQIQRARRRFMKAMLAPSSANIRSTGYHAYDLLLKELRKNNGNQEAKFNNSLVKEFFLHVIPELEGGLSTMSACVSVAPLLGLLGTITGMNRMFDIIYEFGLGSPSLMAEGISIALQATLTGLTVAVAVMFFHNYLNNRKDVIAGQLLKDAEELKRVHFHNRAVKGA